MEVLIKLFLIFTVYLLWRYYCFQKKSEYWKIRNVPSARILNPLNYIINRSLRDRMKVDKLINAYNEYKGERYAGVFLMDKPHLLVRDLDLIKYILVKDFDTFADRTVSHDEVTDPLTLNIFNVEYNKWKFLRTKLMPLFSASKINKMSYLIEQCVTSLSEDLHKQCKIDKDIDCSDTILRYVTHAIGSCFFGMQLENVVGEKEKKIRQINYLIHYLSENIMMKRYVIDILPTFLSRFFFIKKLDPEINTFIMDTVNELLENRKKSKEFREDLLNEFIKLQSEDESAWSNTSIAAQMYIFLVAGLDATSYSIIFSLYELAQVPEIQEKLRSEIISSLKNSSDKPMTSVIPEMKYLEAVHRETLRKNPTLPAIIRKARKIALLPGSSLILPKNSNVVISTYGIHHDPKYFPNPEQFDPERFLDPERVKTSTDNCLSFGLGPRACLGFRLATYLYKIAMVTILRDFRITTSPKTEIPYKISTDFFILKSTNNIILRFEPYGEPNDK